MKFITATFCFDDSELGLIIVNFDDVNGHVEVSTINPAASGPCFTIPNPKRRYKPCATHAMELIRLKLGKKPRTEFAKQRQAAAQVPPVGKTPQLKVHRGKR